MAESTGNLRAFVPPPKGSEEYEAWLDGPMPDAANGRGAWLGGRSARSRRTVVADGAKGGGTAAQSRMAAGSGQPALPVGTGDAGDPATRAALIAIRDNGNAHDSDRIAAMKTLMQMDREEAGSAVVDTPLVALRQVLDLLRPEERLAWLQGERIAHMRAEGHSG